MMITVSWQWARVKPFYFIFRARIIISYPFFVSGYSEGKNVLALTIYPFICLKINKYFLLSAYCLNFGHQYDIILILFLPVLRIYFIFRPEGLVHFSLQF